MQIGLKSAPPFARNPQKSIVQICRAKRCKFNRHVLLGSNASTRYEYLLLVHLSITLRSSTMLPCLFLSLRPILQETANIERDGEENDQCYRGSGAREHAHRAREQVHGAWGYANGAREPEREG